MACVASFQIWDSPFNCIDPVVVFFSTGSDRPSFFSWQRLNPRTGDEGDEVTMKDVYEEFNTKVASRFRIAEFRSKVSTKSYAFEKHEVPNQADYLEVMYSVRSGQGKMALLVAATVS